MKKAWEWDSCIGYATKHPLPRPDGQRKLGRRYSRRTAGCRQHELSVEGVNVTDSLAQLFNIAGTVQAKGNIGYDVSKAEALLEEGKRLYDARNEVELYKHTLRVMRQGMEAPKDESSPYWNFTQYTDFEQYAAAVQFPVYDYDPRKADPKEFYDRIYASWIAQVAAGAVGTALEGFHTTGNRAGVWHGEWLHQGAGTV